MKKISLTFLAFLCCAALAGCGSNRSPGDHTLNLAPGARYASKRGNFTCVVPESLRPIDSEVERYDGDNTFVSFMGAYGGLLRIEGSPIPPEYGGRVATMDSRELLGKMFDRLIMPTECPRASVQSRQDVDTVIGSALFCVVRIPEGSTLAESNGAGEYHRRDSTRGVLMFLKEGWVYVISDQMLLPPFKDDEHHLLTQLQDVVAHMTFKPTS